MAGTAHPAVIAERVTELEALGIRAFTTTRARGTFGSNATEPVHAVMDRWAALRRELAPSGGRFATAHQVHGNRVVIHEGSWQGWLRVDAADGHLAPRRGTGLAVTIADCVPVFVAHPGGAIALLHSGWRGTVAGILPHAITELGVHGAAANDLHIHLGPAICGACYEVSADVHARLTGRPADRPTPVDLRAILAGQARSLGVRHITTSARCTRCDNDRFFSHRAGDAGRQLGVMIADT